MRHTRKEVFKRTIRKFAHLDRLVNNLPDKAWNGLLTRDKRPWTVRDTLLHITHWRADTIKKQRVPVEEKGINWTDGNHLIHERWHDRPRKFVLG